MASASLPSLLQTKAPLGYLLYTIDDLDDDNTTPVRPSYTFVGCFPSLAATIRHAKLDSGYPPNHTRIDAILFNGTRRQLSQSAYLVRARTRSHTWRYRPLTELSSSSRLPFDYTDRTIVPALFRHETFHVPGSGSSGFSRALTVWTALCAHPDTPVSFLKAVFTDAEGTLIVADNLPFPPASQLRFVLQSNPRTPSTILSALSLHQSHQAYDALARNPSSPGRVLTRCFQHECFQCDPDYPTAIIGQVCYHPNTPLPVLHTLAQHPDSQVRRAVIQNPRATPAIILTASLQ